MSCSRSRSPLSIDRITSPDAAEVGQPHSSLRNNPEYRLLFADRIHRLFFNGGILTPDPLIERYTRPGGCRSRRRSSPKRPAGATSTAGTSRPQNWISMRDRILNTYLPQRTAIVLGQFRTAGLYPSVDAPVFYINGAYQHGGHVAASDSLSMKARSGTDLVHPRRQRSALAGPGRPGGHRDSILVPENAAKKVLVPTQAVDNAWRGGRYASTTPPGPP